MGDSPRPSSCSPLLYAASGQADENQSSLVKEESRLLAFDVLRRLFVDAGQLKQFRRFYFLGASFYARGGQADVIASGKEESRLLAQECM